MPAGSTLPSSLPRPCGGVSVHWGRSSLCTRVSRSPTIRMMLSSMVFICWLRSANLSSMWRFTSLMRELLNRVPAKTASMATARVTIWASVIQVFPLAYGKHGAIASGGYVHLAAHDRVLRRVEVNDSLGRLLMTGFTAQPKPGGTLRDSDNVRHSASTPPFIASKLQYP